VEGEKEERNLDRIPTAGDIGMTKKCLEEDCRLPMDFKLPLEGIEKVCH